MPAKDKVDSAIENLGHVAAQCELYASDDSLTAQEKFEQLKRAKSCYDMQLFILRSGQAISLAIATVIADEMLAGGAGYDSRGNWHQPEMPSKPNPWADLRPLPATPKLSWWRSNSFCVSLCFRIQRILRAVFGREITNG